MDDLAGSITDGRFHEQKVHRIDTRTWQKFFGGRFIGYAIFFCMHLWVLTYHGIEFTLS